MSRSVGVLPSGFAFARLSFTVKEPISLVAICEYSVGALLSGISRTSSEKYQVPLMASTADGI